MIGVISMAGGSGGGEIKSYAVISVTYPAGSVCTCSFGGKTWKAPDTSGKAIFGVAENGTYVLSCTDGTATVSKNVTISSQHQIANVELTYSRYLFKAGEGAKVAFTLVYGYSGDSGCVIRNDYMQANGVQSASHFGCYYTSAKIDCTDYSILKVDCITEIDSTYYMSITDVEPQAGSNTNQTTLFQNYISRVNCGGTTRHTNSLNIANITGAHYIGLHPRSSGYFRAYNWWLE